MTVTEMTSVTPRRDDGDSLLSRATTRAHLAGLIARNPPLVGRQHAALPAPVWPSETKGDRECASVTSVGHISPLQALQPTPPHKTSQAVMFVLISLRSVSSCSAFFLPRPKWDVPSQGGLSCSVYDHRQNNAAWAPAILDLAHMVIDTESRSSVEYSRTDLLQDDSSTRHTIRTESLSRKE